jgi:hypothetical protein
MKEVLTKSFWKGVKKTFYEAMEDAPRQKGDPSKTPVESKPITPPVSEAPSPVSEAPSPAPSPAPPKPE